MTTPPADTVPSPPRPLESLRAMIDTVDHEMLDLLARRNALVTEIAAYKRAHGIAIRDRQREQEIIADRRRRAERVGLLPEVIESMLRLMLWASRDRQAALRTEVPPDLPPRTVAVIGGRGQMGKCIAGLFADLGHDVIITDIDTKPSPTDAAATADVVIISVPVDSTVEVIRDLGPRVRKESLLMDVTSIKTDPVRAMLEASQASVVGTHPLFGPSVHSLQGQRIVLTPGRGEQWYGWLGQMLRARGLLLVEATPADHDRAMAVVQVLTHFATEVMGRALSKIGVPLAETLNYTSPVYLMELLMTARHFAQSPELYASIQMSNPLTKEVTAAFVRAAGEHERVIQSSDRKAITDLFEEVREYFGDFTDRALEQSSHMIDRLVERQE